MDVKMQVKIAYNTIIYENKKRKHTKSLYIMYIWIFNWRFLFKEKNLKHNDMEWKKSDKHLVQFLICGCMMRLESIYSIKKSILHTQ